jgi:SAM-dependent methyltransferase
MTTHSVIHGSPPQISAWVARFTPLLPPGGCVLDLACGGGRHARHLLDAGFRVVAVDRDVSAVTPLVAAHGDRLEVREADLEDGSPFPLQGRRFDGILVTNYLHRPLLADLVAGLAPGGVLLYETFAAGNERFGPPTNPAFLLRPGELLDLTHPRLRVVAYEDVTIDGEHPACVQRVAAVAPGA